MEFYWLPGDTLLCDKIKLREKYGEKKRDKI